MAAKLIYETQDVTCNKTLYVFIVKNCTEKFILNNIKIY